MKRFIFPTLLLCVLFAGCEPEEAKEEAGPLPRKPAVFFDKEMFEREGLHGRAGG